jgi:hypothetical protein
VIQNRAMTQQERSAHCCPPLQQKLTECHQDAVLETRWNLMNYPASQLDVSGPPINVRFTNRPFGVKRFQTIHQCNVDVSRGLVLLFGIGTWPLDWGFLCQGIRQGRASFSFVGFLI